VRKLWAADVGEKIARHRRCFWVASMQRSERVGPSDKVRPDTPGSRKHSCFDGWQDVPSPRACCSRVSLNSGFECSREIARNEHSLVGTPGEKVLCSAEVEKSRLAILEAYTRVSPCHKSCNPRPRATQRVRERRHTGSPSLHAISSPGSASQWILLQ